MDDDLGIAWLVKRLIVSKILKSKPAPDITDVDAALNEASTAGRLVWSSMVPDIVRRIVGRGDLENEMAVEYAHGLGTDLDDVSAKALRQGYNASLGKGIDRSLSWARVAEAWGLDGAQMRSWIGTMPKSDYSGEVIPARSRVQLETMINTRADRIKTNEAYAINQIAQQIQWIKMKQTGEMGPDASKRWHTAIDERTCKVCAPINNKIVGVTKTFSRGVFAPPVHPNCRCWVELLEGPTVVTKRDYKRDQSGQFSTVNTYVPYQYPRPKLDNGEKNPKYYATEKAISDGAISPTFYWTEEIRHKLKNADLDQIKNDPDFDPTVPQAWNMIDQKIEPLPKNAPNDFSRIGSGKNRKYLRPHPMTSRQSDDTVTTASVDGRRVNYERPESLLDPKVKWLRENNVVLKRHQAEIRKALALAVERDYKRDESGRFATVDTLVEGSGGGRAHTMVDTATLGPRPSSPAPVTKQPDYAIDEETLKRVRERTAKIPARQVLLTQSDVRDIQRIVDGKKSRDLKAMTMDEFIADVDRPKYSYTQKANKVVRKQANYVSQVIYDSKVAAGKPPDKKITPRYVLLDEMDNRGQRLSVGVKPVMVDDIPMVVMANAVPNVGEVIDIDDVAVAFDPKKHDISEFMSDGKTPVVIRGVTIHPVTYKKGQYLQHDMSQGVVSGQYIATKVAMATDANTEIAAAVAYTPNLRTGGIDVHVGADQDRLGQEIERAQKYQPRLPDNEEEEFDSTPVPEKLGTVHVYRGPRGDLERQTMKFLRDADARQGLTPKDYGVDTTKYGDGRKLPPDVPMT